jgi:AraC family transcriptional regulator
MTIQTKSKATTISLYIKNMVCPRCIKVVREDLTTLGLDVRSVVLGEVIVSGPVAGTTLDAVKSALTNDGFELIEDRNAKTIEKIKHAVIKLAHIDHAAHPVSVKDSTFIADEVGLDYHTLTVLFSSIENITIEQYLILQKIEHVKELLKYDELSLSEIAYRMGYSSVAHISNQFKKVTGMTPTAFKKLGNSFRRPIDHPRSSA